MYFTFNIRAYLYDLELGIFFWFQLNDAFLSLFHISIFDDLRRCREFIFDQIRRILFYRTSKIVRVLSVNINYYCYAWMISIIFHYVSWRVFWNCLIGVSFNSSDFQLRIVLRYCFKIDRYSARIICVSSIVIQFNCYPQKIQ